MSVMCTRRVITHHIQSGEYKKALEVLQVIYSSQTKPVMAQIHLTFPQHSTHRFLGRSSLELVALGHQDHKPSELFYKFSPALMAHVPYLCVEAWIEARDQADTTAAGQPLIEPRKLIPALMRYDPSSTQVRRCLQHFHQGLVEINTDRDI